MNKEYPTQTETTQTLGDIQRSTNLFPSESALSNRCQMGIKEKEIPDQVEKQFQGGVCTLTRRQFSIKIKLHFFATSESNSDSIEELVSQERAAVDMKFVVTNMWMPKQLKSAFRSVNRMYNFLAINVGDSSKVAITREGIKLMLDQSKQVFFNFEEAAEFEMAKNNMLINLQNIEDRLLQFSTKQWKVLQTLTKVFLNQGETRQNQMENQAQKKGTTEKQHLEEADQQLIQKYAQYVLANQEQEFLQDFDQPQWFDEDSDMMNRLTQEQNLIKEFENKFAHTLKQLNTITPPSHPHPVIPFRNSYQSQDRMSTMSSSTVPSGPTPFPPGYTPPHLVKPIAADGFAPEEHLRLTANQSKKEQLRMSKQMLKMGYSAEQVISRLEEIKKAQKSGRMDPSVFSAPSKGPIRPFHIPRDQRQQRQQRQARALSFTSQRPQQHQAPNNDKLVREMLIGLLRQKRYKKLEDIQRHMESEGLITTVQNLKRIVDDIRARNAQRKAQGQSKE